MVNQLANVSSGERVRIMRTAVDNVSLAETLDRIEAFVAEGTPRLIVTANVDHLMLLENNQAFRAAYARADLVTCDSIPLKWALRFLGRPIKERVAGADLIGPLCARAAQRGLSLFFLGAAPGVAAKAKEVLEKRYPGVKIVGTYAPPVMPLDELLRDRESVRRVREARPDVLLVAFGAPKQEIWLDALRHELGVPVGIGVGAAFDFAAGIVKRAPAWVQNAGLEWLWRFFQEPKRLWRRYFLMDARFIYFILKEKIRPGRGDD